MNTKGFTLIEVIISNVILSIAIVIAFTFVSSMLKSVDTELKYKDMNITTQQMLDNLTQDLKESSPSWLDVYDKNKISGNDEQFFENGLQQTAICFPIARNMNGQFVYWDANGVIQKNPVWQGICVYAIHDNQLVRYVDYTWDFSKKPIIGEINDDEIIIVDDVMFPTQQIVFNRDAAHGYNDDQSQLVIRGRVIKQIIRYPYVEDKIVFPISFQVAVEDQFWQLDGETIEVNNYTSIISRNRN